MLLKRPHSFSFSPNPKTKTKTLPPPVQVQLQVLPYRDTTNKLQYTTLSPTSPLFPNHVIPSTSTITDWDSDIEPLIPREGGYTHTSSHSYSSSTGRSVGYIPSHSKSNSYSGRYSSSRGGLRSSVPITIEGRERREELDEDGMRRFTATGGPMPRWTPRGVRDMNELPILLPRRYTDESVIPAVVCRVLVSSTSPSSISASTSPLHSPTSPTPSSPASEKSHTSKRSSIFAKLRRKSKEGKRDGMEGKEVTKVVYMPRGEYLKFFARDLRGVYVGSEPERRWSEGELEREFGSYRPDGGKLGV